MACPCKRVARTPSDAKSYPHSSADLAARPECGAQPHFKKANNTAPFRFDSSLAPALNWAAQHPARETAPHFIERIAPEEVLLVQPAAEGSRVIEGAARSDILRLMQAGIPASEAIMPKTETAQMALFDRSAV